MRGFSGLRDTEEGMRFAAAVIGLRRVVAGYFEKRMIAEQIHRRKDESLYSSGGGHEQTEGGN
jgi:hypothetical protein